MKLTDETLLRISDLAMAIAMVLIAALIAIHL